MDKDAMRAELEAAGYTIGRQGSGSNSIYISAYVGSPDEWEYIGKDYMLTRMNADEITARCNDEALEYAWNRYQEKKRLIAMEALLRRFAALRINQLIEQAYGSDNLLAILELPAIKAEAKKLLGID